MLFGLGWYDFYKDRKTIFSLRFIQCLYFEEYKVVDVSCAFVDCWRLLTVIGL